MWQEIVVGLIGVAVILFIGKKIYNLITASKSKGSCCGCSGCKMKQEKIKKE